VKIVKRGDFVEFTQNGMRHTVRRSDIKRVSFSEDKGHIAIDVPGYVFHVRLMECEGIRAKTSEQLYKKIAGLMKPALQVF
jgi:hypothetical protein